jgi:hypothetical protein
MKHRKIKVDFYISKGLYAELRDFIYNTASLLYVHLLFLLVLPSNFMSSEVLNSGQRFLL